MAKRAAPVLDSAFFLQLALGLFFVMLGVSGLTSYNSKLSEFARLFGRNDGLNLVLGVVELVMGVVLVLGLFVAMPKNLAGPLALVLFGLWALYIVMRFVTRDFMEPNFVAWTYNLSWHLVILVSLWVVGRRYR